MRHRTSRLLFAAAWLVMAAVVVAGEPVRPAAPQKAGAPEKQADKAATIGQPVSIVIRPEAIRLTGPRDRRRIRVTGRYPDGTARTPPSFFEFSAENPGGAH